MIRKGNRSYQLAYAIAAAITLSASMSPGIVAAKGSTKAIIGTGADAIIGTGADAIIGTGADAIIGTGVAKVSTDAIIGTGRGGKRTDAIIGTGADAII